MLAQPIQCLTAVLVVQTVAAAGVLSLHRLQGSLRRALPYLIAMAVGVLLATGLVHLLPESVEALGNRPAVWLTLLCTLIALYTFERIFHLLSGVDAEPPAEASYLAGHDHHHASKPATLLLGCVTHSLVDGTSVAAAFAVDHRIGWITALAVGLHEIPHRLGDFALLLHMGLRRNRAALLAIGAGASSLVGWAIVTALGAYGSRRVAWLLPVSAGSFLYISLVDLLPELRKQAGHESHPAAVLWQIVALASGMVLAISLSLLPGA